MHTRDWYLSALLLGVVVAALFLTTPTHAQSLALRLSGKILLQVEQHGEAWYVFPNSHERYFLGRPADAFGVMRQLGLGISDTNLALIPVAGSTTRGNLTLQQRLSGKILLQVEQHGEAWYVNPDTLKRTFLGRPDDAFALMRGFGLGISDKDLLSIPVAAESAPANGISIVAPTNGTALHDGHDADRQTVLQHINAARQSLSLPPYVLVAELSQATQAQADDMTANNYFAFRAPDGRTISDFAAAAGYEAHSIGENIVQTNMGAASLVSSWQNKNDTSWNNVIDHTYMDLGVGVGRVNGMAVYTVAFSQSLKSYFEITTAPLADLNAVRSEMLTSLNAERAKVGLSALVINSKLNTAAQDHSADMLARAYYAHESPEGSTPLDRVKIAGYDPILVAENIAKNQFSVAEVMQAWMDSPEHRANILDNRVVDVGFGLAYGHSADGYTLLWVQDFGQPRM